MDCNSIIYSKFSVFCEEENGFIFIKDCEFFGKVFLKGTVVNFLARINAFENEYAIISKGSWEGLFPLSLFLQNSQKI